MNIALIVLAFLCAAIGLLGSIVPGLPGPPLSWVGLLLLNLSGSGEFSVWVIVVAALLAIIITIFDYVVPSMGTKKFGGSKAGVWGCNIGIILGIVGLPFGPQGLLGIIFWPFIGAFIGELTTHKPAGKSLTAAFGAFIGFLAGTLSKLIYCVAAVVLMIGEMF